MNKEALQKLYSRNRIIIFPALVGLAGLSLIVLVIIPQIIGYLKSQDDAKKTQSRLEILEVKAAELSNLPEEELKQKLQFAVTALPTTKDYTSVIGLIQRLSVESGVTLESVNLDTSKSASLTDVNSFAVNVEIASSKISLDEFLKRIEDGPVLMKIGRIEVNLAGSDDSVTASVLIDVFFSPTPKNLGSVETPLPKLSEEEQQLVLELESKVALVPVSILTPTGEITEQPPANILPRGKANPFE